MGYGQTIFESLARKIIRLDEDRVCKSGVLNRRETDTMRFIADNTTIPVPKVRQTRWNSAPEKGSEYIMDYMPGQPLDRVWKTLNHEQKVSICHQLGGYLSQLKRLKGKRIEGMNGTAVSVGIRDPRMVGPFETEKEFNDFLFKSLDRLPSDLKHYARAGFADNHEIHFMHGDFNPRNILVDENNRVSAVLDWEMAGWYPEYWDVFRILCEPNNRNMPDYRDYFQHIHPYEYVKEFLAMRYWLLVSGNL